jgi:OOP family OmpA-OmpF porin
MAKKKVSSRLRQIGDGPSRSPVPPMPGRQDETQLVELGLFISVTVFGTLILVGLAVFFGVRAIENHLETEALRAVDFVVRTAAEEDPAFRNITDISADATGFDVYLRGTVDNEDMLATIPGLVERIEGVGKVSAELQWIPRIEIDQPDVVAAPINLSWANGSATISGEVSDEATRTVVIGELEDLFPNGVDAEALTVAEGVPSERDWISKILGVFRIGAQTLPTGELFVSSGERLVQMSGEYETRQQRREARDAIDELIGATTFAFVSSLSIPEAPAFTPEEVVELQENLDDLIEGKVVEFELNSDVLTEVGTALLDEILLALEKFPAVPIEIGGHTDNQGDAEENLDLSRRRAQSAFDYLVARGQDPERFVVVGYGEDVPVASNDTADGRARNRRIEFKALGE